MCTAISCLCQGHFFGRNLDLDRCYGESVTVMPRGFSFPYRLSQPQQGPYAMVGMAHVHAGCPLYYDAVNERGLCMAGLRFPQHGLGCAPQEEGKTPLAPYELIPYLLSRCANASQAVEALEGIRLEALPVSQDLPLVPLHWMVCDEERCLVIEPEGQGLVVLENPVGVLTNEPDLSCQLAHLDRYLSLEAAAPENRFAPTLPLRSRSLGTGAVGLPGDWSSESRFVRAAFTRWNAVPPEGDGGGLANAFHILCSVCQPRGCARTAEGLYEQTVYTCVCDTRRGVYYYTTYENAQLCAVDLHREDLNGAHLSSYPLLHRQQVHFQN